MRALVLLLVLAGCGTIEAARLLRDAVAPAEELAGAVEEREDEIAGLRARFYWPREDAGDALSLLLSHGAHEDGIDDPRFLAFARALAIRGFAVCTPEFESLQELRLDAKAPDRLAAAAAALDGPVALVGISFGGTYSLIAAARPELRDRVRCVLTVGSYADLEQLLAAWMAEASDHFVKGRRAVLLGNLDRLVPARDRATVERGVRAAIDGEAYRAPRGLGERGRRVLAAARSEGPLGTGLLQPLADEVAALTPRAAPAAPVFVLHGAADRIIPPDNADRLAERLRAMGADVEVMVTDLFGHTDPEFEAAPSYFEARPLLRFTARFLDAARP